MKLHNTKNFCYGVVLISAAIAFYFLLLYKFVLAPILVFILVLIIVLKIRRISFQIEEDELAYFNGSVQVFREKLTNFGLYRRGNSFFNIVTHNDRIIFGALFVNDRGLFLRDIFSNEDTLIEKAERNGVVAIKKAGLLLSSIVACVFLMTPIIQYNQIPANDNELIEVHGVLEFIELQKLLKLKLSGHEASFILSPKAGNLVNYEQKLNSFIDKDISLYISATGQKRDDSMTEVWLISEGGNPIIEYEQIVQSWMNWKRWAVLLSIGFFMLYYSVFSFRKLRFK